MSSANIAASAALANQAQTQSALMTKMTKANADAEKSVIEMLQAANENSKEDSKGPLAPGVGGAMDVSA